MEQKVILVDDQDKQIGLEYKMAAHKMEESSTERFLYIFLTRLERQ
jgi:isopentenyldiphosphate isomerase